MAFQVRCNRMQRHVIQAVWQRLPLSEDQAWRHLDEVIHELVGTGARTLALSREQQLDCAQQVNLALVKLVAAHEQPDVPAPASFVARIVHDKLVDGIRVAQHGRCASLETATTIQDHAATAFQLVCDARTDLATLLEHAHNHHGFTRKDWLIVVQCCVLSAQREHLACDLFPPADGRHVQRLEKSLSRALIKLRNAAVCIANSSALQAIS